MASGPTCQVLGFETIFVTRREPRLAQNLLEMDAWAIIFMDVVEVAPAGAVDQRLVHCRSAWALVEGQDTAHIAPAIASANTLQIATDITGSRG